MSTRGNLTSPLTTDAGVHFDPAALRESVAALTAQVPWAFTGTRQIALHHRPGSTDEWYEGCRSEAERIGERSFTVLNSLVADSYLGHVLESLPFQPYRARLMALDPRYCYSTHRDQTPRYHLAIETSEHAHFVFVERSVVVTIPADGRLYYVDTRQLHTALNGAETERIHLVVAGPAVG